ncbi:MAG: hypothetical protein ACJAZP_002737 [Psychromonas sp.]|jgi:hypothetical protein|uniref:COG3014 family protein n=1 Tax=Psychromonas sp. TaxID=1884585 RepID=UPI0039E3B462
MKRKILPLVLSSIVLSGCTSITQSNQEKAFTGAISQGDVASAINYAKNEASIDPETGLPDDLLWALQSGTILYGNGSYKESIVYFDAAEDVMRIEDTEGVVADSTQTAGSLFGNDAMLDYEQTQYDGVMANYYKAWSFWNLGDTQNARVEWNRAEERQRRAVQYFKSEILDQKEELAKEDGEKTEGIKKAVESDATNKALSGAGINNTWQSYDGYINPAVTYAGGLFFMLNGESHSDYQKSADLLQRVYSITNDPSVKTDLQMANALAKGESKSAFKPAVWVIVEDGMSASFSEVRVDLPLGVLKNSKVQYVGMAFPKMVDGTQSNSSIQVGEYQTHVIADMDKIIGGEFNTELPMIITREITRATLKAGAQAIAENQDATGLAGLALGLVSAFTTGADTRSVTALPNSIQLARFNKTSNKINIKVGSFDVPLELSPDSKNQIVHIRTYNNLIAPKITVIDI